MKLKNKLECNGVIRLKWTIARIFGKRCSESNVQDFFMNKYDMRALNDRFHMAMFKTGKTRADIAELFGMDAKIPLALQPSEKVPRPTMENIVRVSNFLGVSVRWMLTGEPENDVDVFVGSASGGITAGNAAMGASATHGAAIIAGANNSTVVVQNGQGDGLTAMEREAINTIRKLPPREQAATMSYIFALEKEGQDQRGGGNDQEPERIRIRAQNRWRQKAQEPMEGSCSRRLDT